MLENLLSCGTVSDLTCGLGGDGDGARLRYRGILILSRPRLGSLGSGSGNVSIPALFRAMFR